MEEVKIRRFLAVDTNNGYGFGYGFGFGDGSGFRNRFGDGSGDGSGSGSGDGSGDGSGFGDGSGSGSGFGSGFWDGDGFGFGFGDGYDYDYGIGLVNGHTLYSIDGIPTLIRQISGNVARGAIFNRDFTFTPCYIVKQGRFFAHGETLAEAVEAVRSKAMEGMPECDRIAAFVEAHERDRVYPNSDFFQWHHNLTGSCEAGRKAFARDHNIDMTGSMTVLEFIALTENSYGGTTIKKLREFYE